MTDLKVEVLDTQVISYAAKNKYEGPIAGSHISSITAKEYLLLQDQHPTRARYYVPLVGKEHLFSLMVSRRDHPFPKSMTDSLILDLGLEYGTVVEYSDASLARAINDQDELLYAAAISHLPKEDRRLLQKRFTFLLASGVRCIPLSPSIVEPALNLLVEFTEVQNTKSNFRNTLNDILIAATALDVGGRLITYDQELSRFCRRTSPQLLSGPSGTTVIEFAAVKEPEKIRLRDSKGYLNRGWQFRLQRHNS